MWREIGFAAVIGVATIMLVIPLQGVYVKKMLVIRLEVTVYKHKNIKSHQPSPESVTSLNALLV
jgi:hypothetical protein